MYKNKYYRNLNYNYNKKSILNKTSAYKSTIENRNEQYKHIKPVAMHSTIA